MACPGPPEWWNRLLQGNENVEWNKQKWLYDLWEHNCGEAWDDLRFPAGNLKAGSAGVPTWNNTYGLQEFSIGDYLFCQVQLPHAWKVGSTLKPHFHWMKITSGPNLVGWQLEYRWAKIGEVMDVAWTTISDETPDVSDGDTAWQHALTALPDIVPPSDVQISDMLVCKISRIATAGASYGTRAALLEFDIHYQIDSRGSRQEYVK
jgi:hypothetical protein